MSNFANIARNILAADLEQLLDDRDGIRRALVALEAAGREEGQAYGEWLEMLAEISERIRALEDKLAVRG